MPFKLVTAAKCFKHRLISSRGFIHSFWPGPILEINSKIKLGDQMIELQNNLKYWGIYQLNGVI